MIDVVGVAVTLEEHEGQLREVWDNRVLTAAREILLDRFGVKSVEFDSVDSGSPILIVVFDDWVPTGGFVSITDLISDLTQSRQFRFVYAEDGGWKVQLHTLKFEVTGL